MESIETALSLLINQKELADVKFIVGINEREIYGHRLILASSSEFWMKMFYGLEWKEVTQKNIAEVHVPDFEEETFLQILRYVYTRELILNEENVLDILRGADKYLINDLLDFCSDFLLSHLNFEICFQVLHFSHYIAGGRLLRETIRFIEKFSSKIPALSNGFLGFEADLIKEILELEQLKIPEINLFQQVVEWGERQAKINAGKVRDYVSEFLPLIKFDVMQEKDLLQVIQSGFCEPSMILPILADKRDGFDNSIGRRGALKKPIENIKVIVVASDDRATYVNDAVESIKSTGIWQVDTFNGRIDTPTLEKLLEYDVVFVYADYNWNDHKAVSDVVKSFVEAGGGLVLCGAFALSTDHPLKDFMGDIVNEFLPLAKGSVSRENRSSLGKFDRNHPIMENVKNFDGGKSSFFVNTKEVFGGNVVAWWSNQKPLVIEKKTQLQTGQMIVLNIFPISEKGFSNGWIPDTDGRTLIANSCVYAAHNSPHSL